MLISCRNDMVSDMSNVQQPQDRALLDQEQFLTILSREEALRRFEAALFPRAIPGEARKLADALGRQGEREGAGADCFRTRPHGIRDGLPG